uniref:Vegetative cell wall protein gp1 n=1 Tax=Ixodes ricinus TaxID=34613 RepID=V5GJ12_IXORI
MDILGITLCARVLYLMLLAYAPDTAGYAGRMLSEMIRASVNPEEVPNLYHRTSREGSFKDVMKKYLSTCNQGYGHQGPPEDNVPPQPPPEIPPGPPQCPQKFRDPKPPMPPPPPPTDTTAEPPQVQPQPPIPPVPPGPPVQPPTQPEKPPNPPPEASTPAEPQPD